MKKTYDTLALVNSVFALVLGSFLVFLAFYLSGWWTLGLLPGAAAQTMGVIGAWYYRPGDRA